ncbi:MAG: hypothetical protein V8P98_00140 [Acutalibacteraceae bacterium]
MKNKVLMRTISIILAFSFCMPTLNITYSMSPNCYKLNKNSRFDNEDCTIINSLEKISSGEKFIRLNNVGCKSEYDLLFLIAAKLMVFYQI